jgi:hypothetical protein
MARRPDREKTDILSEEDVQELRHNLAPPESRRDAGLLRTGLSRLPNDLQPAAQRTANADAGAGVEAVAEVALKAVSRLASTVSGKALLDRAFRGEADQISLIHWRA